MAEKQSPIAEELPATQSPDTAGPERIWIAYDPNDPDFDLRWTQIRVDGDIEYVRADLARVLPRSEGGEGEAPTLEQVKNLVSEWNKSRERRDVLTVADTMALEFQVWKFISQINTGTPSQVESEAAWRSIESAPERERILIANVNWDAPVREEYWKSGGKWLEGMYPTHWQPLPQPPPQSKQEK